MGSWEPCLGLCLFILFSRAAGWQTCRRRQADLRPRVHRPVRCCLTTPVPGETGVGVSGMGDRQWDTDASKRGEPIHQWPALTERKWAAPGPTVMGIDPASPGPLTQVLGDHAPFGFLATQGTTKDAFSQNISPSSWACVFTTQFIRYKELYFCVFHFLSPST